MTPVDHEVERVLRRALAEARPDDAVLGEEGGLRRSAASSRRWILDPLDGTKRFLHGLPVFATLIALETGGELQLGVASAPALGRRWWASAGRGAFADGRPARVSGRSELGGAHLVHGSLDGWIAGGRLAALTRVAERCRLVSSPGDFLMYMQLAEGEADVVVDPDARYWDLAAPRVIVEAAGGRFTDLDGRPTAEGGTACATNGLLQDEVLRLLAQA